MPEPDKTFIDIVVSENYHAYSDTIIHVNKKKYLVRIPVEDVRLYLTALNKIRYRLEHTTPPHKRGRKKVYSSDDERRQAYIARRRKGLLNPEFGKAKLLKAQA